MGLCRYRFLDGGTKERRTGEMNRLPMLESKRRGWQMWPRVTQLARMGCQFSNPLGTASFLMALVVVCAVAALMGGALARQMRLARPDFIAVVPTGHLVEAGGLLLQVAAVTWLVHASAEARRLRVDIRFQNPNSSRDPRQIRTSRWSGPGTKTQWSLPLGEMPSTIPMVAAAGRR
jgi:hypothetical protein